MKKWRVNSNLLKFALVVLLFFSLPVLAVERTVLQDVATHVFSPQNAAQAQKPVATVLPAVPTAGSDWTMYLHDPERTSATKETILSPENASQLKKLWSFNTGDIVAASAAVVKGVVYIGSWNGYEYALDEMTGRQLWRTFLGTTTARPDCNPTQVGITSSASVENGTVYVGGGDAYWYALDAKTGNVLWKVFTGDNSAAGGHYNWSSPLLYNGYAYIGIASEGDCPLVPGQLLKVSLTTHTIVQTLNLVADGQIGGGIWTSPSVDSTTNTIFISSGTATSYQEHLAQAVFSLDATTMQIKSVWTLPAAAAIGDSDFDTTPILFTNANGKPLVASVNKNGTLYAFNRNNIAAGPVWTQNVAVPGMCPRCENSTVSSNALGQGTLYVAAGVTALKSQYVRGSVGALDPTTGKYLWHYRAAGPVLGSLVYTNGLIICAAGHYLEVLDATTGAALYTYRTKDVVYSTPVVSHGQIFMGSSDGNVYAFSLPTQAVQANFATQCLSGWVCQDIGAPVLIGSNQSTNKTITITAGGRGIVHTSDQFHFVSKNVSGDTQITTQVLSEQTTGVGGPAQAGLMARQRNDPDAPYYGVFLVKGVGLVVQFRTEFGGDVQRDIQMPGGKAPLYLRITHIDEQFQAATSLDGEHYTTVLGSVATMALPTTVDYGLVVSSNEIETQQATVFSLPTIYASTTASSGFMPTTTGCPIPWACSDIGNPASTGGQSFNNGNWTIRGSGADIWNDYDQFHYVWQHLSGDGSVTVHITAHQAEASYAKVGIMVRENLLPDSPYYAVYVESGTVKNGIGVEARYLQGVISSQYAGVAGPAPSDVYLRIVRLNHAKAFSAYYSHDGVNWKFIDVSTIPMAMDNTAIAGIAITSHDTNATSTANFDNPSVVEYP
ncbi:MAG: hypothetical protein NVSMB54_23780 [Ktedonobacteraceae bacterium]